MVDAQQSEVKEENKSLFGVIVHSFFVIPFLLAVFSVLLFVSVRILTMENRTVYDYLEDIKIGGMTKRWQSAFELSKILANPKLVPQDSRFVEEMVSVFEKSEHDDARVRQYLALAMGRTGNAKFISPLIKNLSSEKDENLAAIIYAIGILKSNQSVDEILPYLKSQNPRVRLVTAMALGNIGEPQSVLAIGELLNDEEPNVRWEAAVALAKNNNVSARSILLNLLDRNYFKKFPQVDSEEQTHVMLVVIQAVAGWDDQDIKERLKQLSQTDQNTKVRSAAVLAIQTHDKNS